jgi:hypothetical protein
MHRLARLARIAGTARDNFVNLGLGSHSASNGSGVDCDAALPGSRFGNLIQGRSPGTGSAGGSTEEGGDNGTWYFIYVPPGLG